MYIEFNTFKVYLFEHKLQALVIYWSGCFALHILEAQN